MDDKKECIVSCVEFILCGLIALFFLVVASLCFILRDWLVAALSLIVGIISGYYAIKSVSRYFDLTDSENVKEEK